MCFLSVEIIGGFCICLVFQVDFGEFKFKFLFFIFLIESQMVVWEFIEGSNFLFFEQIFFGYFFLVVGVEVSLYRQWSEEQVFRFFMVFLFVIQWNMFGGGLNLCFLYGSDGLFCFLSMFLRNILVLGDGFVYVNEG